MGLAWLVHWACTFGLVLGLCSILTGLDTVDSLLSGFDTVVGLSENMYLCRLPAGSTLGQIVACCCFFVEKGLVLGASRQDGLAALSFGVVPSENFLPSVSGQAPG